MLTTLYDTGARVRELLDLRVRGARLDTPAIIALTGKRAKTRHVPLKAPTAASYALVEIGEAVSASIRRVPYDVSKACDILVQVGYPYAEFLGQWLQTGMQPTTPSTVASHGKSDLGR